MVILSSTQFVVPAALSIAVVGLVVFEFFLSSTDDIALARTALTFTAIGCGLSVLLFLEPPTPAWVAANPSSGEWRPTILAVALFGLFVAILAIPTLRDFYELELPDAWGFAVIGFVIVGWAVALRAAWRLNLHQLLANVWRRST
jgi:cation-transporting ATPase E